MIKIKVSQVVERHFCEIEQIFVHLTSVLFCTCVLEMAAYFPKTVNASKLLIFQSVSPNPFLAMSVRDVSQLSHHSTSNLQVLRAFRDENSLNGID